MSLIFDEVISAQSCVSQEVYHGQCLCTYDPLMLKDFLEILLSESIMYVCLLTVIFITKAYYA